MTEGDQNYYFGLPLNRFLPELCKLDHYPKVNFLWLSLVLTVYKPQPFQSPAKRVKALLNSNIKGIWVTKKYQLYVAIIMMIILRQVLTENRLFFSHALRFDVISILQRVVQVQRSSQTKSGTLYVWLKKQDRYKLKLCRIIVLQP